MQLRATARTDVDEILGVYKRTAATPGGLSRLEHEIDAAYVDGFVGRAIDRGVSLVAIHDDRLVGEIHASKPGPACFDHVLSDLTIAVDPAYRSIGVGRALFEGFMQEVSIRTDVLRVELIARESNDKAIRFYESLGFSREGRMGLRIRNVDGSFEADIPMAWHRGPHSAK